MEMLKKFCWAFLFVLAIYYVGEMVAFANTLQWHNNNHPLVVTSGLDGKILDDKGIKIGDYYITNVGHHDLYLNANLESRQECSICKGEKDKPLLIKIVWPLCGLDNKLSNGNISLAKK